MNMMNPAYQEIGIGIAQGSNYTYLGSGTPYGVISTQDFAYKTQNPFLTGVVFNDNVTHDNFYTPGEGVGNVTITATLTSGGGGSFSTVTWSSGGLLPAIAGRRVLYRRERSGRVRADQHGVGHHRGR